jgi:Mg-chelatase subunit ChlD
VEPVYLPILLKTEPCTPQTRNADVAMVLDTSGSMSDPTTPGGPTKFDAAKAAAKTFLENLVAGRDQAAIVQFNSTAEVLVHLTPDPAAAVAGLAQLTQSPGTRIDLALKVAREELTGPAHRARNNAVLILLTDGEPSGTTPEEVLAEATLSKNAGILVFTIGLGETVDHNLLRGIATEPDWYFPAPDTSDLAGIYERIAYSIPCKPEWP